MDLSYDFDIFDVIPAESGKDPELSRFLTTIGFDQDKGPTQVALFRNKETAEALRHAPPSLREYFIDAGFGLNTYDSGAPAGRYPVQDEEARLVIIRRLTNLAGHYSLPAEPSEPGVFSLRAFLSALDQSSPIDMGTEALPTPSPAAEVVVPQPRPLRRSEPVSPMPAPGRLADLKSRLLSGLPLWGQLRRGGSTS